MSAQNLLPLSDVCVSRVHLGLNLGGTGNLPWSGCDGSLLAGGGPVAVGVLDATAGAPGIPPTHVSVGALVLVAPLPCAPLGRRSSVGAGPVPVRLGGSLLLSPLCPSVALGTLPASVPALCGGVFLLRPPVPHFSAGLLATGTPRAGGLRVFLFPLGAFSRTLGALLSLALGLSIPAHVLHGSTVFAWTVGPLRMSRPALAGSFGTGRLGVAPVCLPGVPAGTDAAPVVLLVPRGSGHPAVRAGDLIGGGGFVSG